MSDIKMIHKDAVTTTYATLALAQEAGCVVGERRQDKDGNIYRFVKFTEGGVTAVAGAPCMWLGIAGGTVVADCDESGVGTESTGFAGVLLSVVTANYYCWILVNGFYDNLKGDTAIAKGEPLKVGADIFDTGTTGTDHIIGVALDQDAQGDHASTYFPGIIRGMLV